MPRTLYIVPTPIGNLEDITLRALRILREVTLIAAEDTRTSGNLLRHYEIRTPLTSYHEHNKLRKLDAIFDALETGDVALVSDAGTPGISDPGYELIREAIARGITIVSLPGACAAVTALVASGLPTEAFVYLGFPPRKAGELRDFFTGLVSEQRTIILYESPNRLTDTLAAAIAALGEARACCVGREISKIYEEFWRGALAAARDHYTTNPPRGEIVLLIAGAPEPIAVVWDEAAVAAAVRDRLAEGVPLREAAKAIAADAGWDRREVYALGVAIKDEGAADD